MILALTATLIGCLACYVTFVTTMFADTYHKERVWQKQESARSTQNNFHNWDVSVSCFSAYHSAIQSEIESNDYNFSIWPTIIDTTDVMPDSVLFTVNSIVLTLLPINIDTLMTSSAPTVRIDSPRHRERIGFGRMYLDSTVDSIRVNYEVIYSDLTSGIVDSALFDYLIYRFESKERVGSLLK